MAITLIINGVSQTVDSGASIPVTPSDRIQIEVNGVVIDPTTIARAVNPPDVTLTLLDGQTVTLEGFVDLSGQAGGGLLGAEGDVVVASTPEALSAPAAGGDGGPDTAGANNASTFNQADPGGLGSEFGTPGGATGGIGTGDGGPPAADGSDQDPNELLTVLLDGPGDGTPTPDSAASTTTPTDGTTTPTDSTTTPTDGTTTLTAPNVAPVTVADASAVTEDSPANPVSGNVLTNDSDSDGPAALTVSQVNGLASNVGVLVGGTFGSLTIGADGAYSYTLDNALPAVQALAQGATEQEIFTYDAFDGLVATLATLTITITGANEAPVTVVDSGAVTEDAVPNTATGNVLTNDSDVDGPTALTVSQVNGLPGNVGVLVGGTFGGVTIGADGAFTYTLDNALPAVQALAQGATAQEVFTYQAFDGLVATASTLTITVNGANDAPDAVDDSVATDADLAFGEDDGPSSITTDILGNDTDPDTGDILTVTAIDTTGTTGLATLVGGVVSYDPNGAFNSLAAGASAVDSFTYTVSDENGGTATATASITVNGANEAPEAVDDSVATDADLAFGEDDGTRAITADILGNDTDPDTGDTLVVSAIDTTGTTGLVTLVGGVVSYNPNGAFEALAQGASATDTFNYTADDGNGGADSATVTVTINGVNNPPVLDVMPQDLAFIEAEVDGMGGVDGLNSAQDVAVSPDGQHVYATGTSDDAVAIFGRNTTTGELTFVGVVKDGQLDGSGNLVDGLDVVRNLVVSPDGAHVYVTSSSEATVAIFGRDATSGELTFIGLVEDGVGGVDGLRGAWALAISPDGAHLYVGGSAENEVAIFSREPATGALTFFGIVKDGVGGVDGIGGAFAVAVSPDGAHVYVGGTVDDAVAIFSRDATTGALTFVDFVDDGVGGVEGLNGVRSVSVSPDGAHVYAAGFVDDAVAIFSRNATTGALTFVGQVEDGVNGVDGLDAVEAVTVSPDGSLVYAAGFGDGAVAVFERNATTGELTFVDLIRNGVDGVNGLAGILAVTTSPDGAHVYTASDLGDAVAAFRASPAFVENGGPVTLAPDGTLSDVDDSELESLTATLTAAPDGAAESLTVEIALLPAGIASSGYDPATRTLVLTGTASVADYQAALRLIQYNNTSDTPDTGDRTITFVANDGDDNSTVDAATVTVTAANDAPDAVDDSVTTDADLAFGEDDGTRAITADILGNDTDPDTGDTLTVTAIDTTGTTGLATLVGGVVSYNPNGAFESLAVGASAVDTFTYTVSDGNGGSDTATVAITINGANDPVDAQDDTLAITETEVEVSTVAPAFNLFSDNSSGPDTDPDGDVFTITQVGDIVLSGFAAAGVNVTNAPAFGAGPPFKATIEIDDAAATAVLTVNADGTANLAAGIGDPFAALGTAEAGTIAFTYTIDDANGSTDTATATITVNGNADSVDALDDTLAITVSEVETSTVAPDFNLFVDNGNGPDSDPDDDAFTITQVGNIVLSGFAAAGVNVTNAPAFGAGPPFAATIEIDDGAATAVLTVNEDGTANLAAGVGDPFAALGAAESGTIAFTYTIEGANGSTDTATATVAVSVNASPALTGLPTGVAALEDITTSIGFLGEMLSDPDNSPIALTLRAGSGFLSGVANGNPFSLRAVTFVGTPAQINTVLATMEYTSAANANGTDTLTLTANDRAGGITTRLIEVSIAPVNDPPVGADITITIDEDTPRAFAAADFGFADPNDTPDDVLANVIITTLPASGTLTLGGVAVSASQVIPVGQINSLVYTPATNVNGAGAASFTFQVQDNGGTANGGMDTDPTPNTITIDVTPVNDPPVLSGFPTSLTVLEDVTTSLGFASAMLSDPDNSQIALTIRAGSGFLSGVANGNPFSLRAVTFVGTPNQIEAVLDTMEYTSAANGDDTDTLTVTANDRAGGITTRLIEVTITPVNNPPLPLLAAVSPQDSVVDPLKLSDLEPILEAAAARWSASGLRPEQEILLTDLQVSIADLPGAQLGAGTSAGIVIDIDGAGHGWFIDPTPLDDSEFELTASETRLYDSDGPASESLDLLATVLHELGHSLGLADLDADKDPDNLMASVLDLGERRLPADGQAGEPSGEVLINAVEPPIDGASERVVVLVEPADDGANQTLKPGDLLDPSALDESLRVSVAALDESLALVAVKAETEEIDLSTQALDLGPSTLEEPNLEAAIVA